jgi:hypothetical protein
LFCSVSNILGGSGFEGRKIDLALDAAGQPLPWPELDMAGWTCASSNWNKAVATSMVSSYCPRPPSAKGQAIGQLQPFTPSEFTSALTGLKVEQP